MAASLPGLNLIAEPGRRRQTLEVAREIERRGFAEIQVSSSYANMTQCVGLALATERIAFATAIAPIYAQTADEFAQTAAYIHELSEGRFRFGIGVAHGPTSGWGSSPASRSATFAPSSRRTAPIATSARCRRSCWRRCGSG